MEKTLEIYKTIKYKEEIFFHPTVSVCLPDSKAAAIFQLRYRQISKNCIFFAKLTEAEKATMLVRRH